MSNDTYNTYDAMDLARISVETAKQALEQAQEALQESYRVHEASHAVENLSWEDAVEELSDNPYVGSYEFAEAILRNDRGGDPAIAGVDVAHLTPYVIYAIEELTRYVRPSDQAELVTLVAKADDPLAEAAALSKRLVENDYGFLVLAA
jgi:hypothetical protein